MIGLESSFHFLDSQVWLSFQNGRVVRNSFSFPGLSEQASFGGRRWAGWAGSVGQYVAEEEPQKAKQHFIPLILNILISGIGQGDD